MDAKCRILEKTQELFNRFGVKRVTMDDIAGQCGISKKTIYQYFRDKDQLVDAFTADRIEDNKKLCEVDKEQAENAIHEIFLAMDMVKEMFQTLHPGLLHDLEKYYPDTFTKFRKHKEEYLYNVIKENLAWGVRDGIYRDDFDVNIMTRYRLESMLLPFNLDIFPESRYQITTIEQEIMEHFIYGLATDEGRLLINKYKNQRTINRKADV